MVTRPGTLPSTGPECGNQSLVIVALQRTTIGATPHHLPNLKYMCKRLSSVNDRKPN